LGKDKVNKMKYSIGRGADTFDNAEGTFKKLIVPNTKDAQAVMAQHALLKVEKGVATIRPVGKSRVYVNDFEIKVKKLNPAHRIRLGEEYSFYLHYFFKIEGDKIVSERKSFDFSDEFKTLQPFWIDYLKTEKNLKRKKQLFADLSRLPYLIGPVLSNVFSKDQEEKMQNKIIDHQRHSICVCPMCRQPLEGKSWEEWKAQNGHSCGANW